MQRLESYSSSNDNIIFSSKFFEKFFFSNLPYFTKLGQIEKKFTLPYTAVHRLSPDKISAISVDLPETARAVLAENDSYCENSVPLFPRSFYGCSNIGMSCNIEYGTQREFYSVTDTNYCHAGTIAE